ncbi:MAG TPA: IS110 family transposase [Bryobacteraceae bacterium]|jgi:transposase|nr:IS110 family transposase [Bryobacteraceae bacterium]
MRKSKASIYERLTNGKLNRQQRKELKRRLYSEDPGLEVVHRNVAGIDVGNGSHYVAVAPGRDPQPVREFGSWTAALHAMADWLKSLGIEHVVMQSTGVYWIGVYEVLEARGFRVCLTNARETKNLPGRKSDVQESQWLMKLHTYGLLRNSFRPAEQIRRLRTIWRLRDRHVHEASREIQHMQKALTTMNVQLANTISDLSGLTGQAIVRAILGGERDPYRLAELRDPHIQASREEIARSLEGRWQEEVLFELQQAVDRYDFCYRQIRDCDARLQQYLAEIPSHERSTQAAEASASTTASDANGKCKKKKAGRKRRQNEPDFDLETELTRICGVRLTAIEGVDVTTVQTWVAELGVDVSAWPSEDHLVSWLNLSPKRQISGGKLIKHEHSHAKNRVANALRMAATALFRSDSYLGARFRSLRGRLGPGKAVKAMAAHLARLMYRMLKHGQAWVDRGAAEHEQRRQQREQFALERKASALGFRLVPAA